MMYRRITTSMTPVPAEAILGALPRWLPWWPVAVYVPAALVVAMLSAATAVGVGLGLRPRLGERTWVERARTSAPARVALRALFWPSIMYAAVVLGMKRTPAVPDLVAAVQLPAVLIAACCGVVFVRTAFERRLRGVRTSSRQWWLELVVLLFVQPAFVIAVIVLWAAPEKPGPMAFGIVIAVGMLFATTNAGLEIARALGLARPASARTCAIVDRVAARTGILPRRVYELAMPTANALALPLQRTVCVTDGMLAMLDDEEATAIVAHEVGHVGDRRALMPLTVVAVFAPPAVLATRLMSSATILWALAFLWIVAVFALRRLQRRREVHADSAARDALDDPRVYAHALERLYEVNVVPVVGSRATHPDLYDRMLAAGVVPAYPRPARPSRLRTIAATVAGMAVAISGISALSYAPWWWRAAQPRALAPNLAVLSLDPHSYSSLRVVAEARYRRGDRNGAAALYDVLEHDHPRSGSVAARHAVVLAGARRCPQAREAAKEALRRKPRVRYRLRARRVIRFCDGDGDRSDRTAASRS
jgi:Zn-dependent protease with chaperone function